MTFLNELIRSKMEQHTCNGVYNKFKEKMIYGPGGATGPSGPGGGSWWWLDCGSGSEITDGIDKLCNKR